MTPRKQTPPLSWRPSTKGLKAINKLAKEWGISRNAALDRCVMLVSSKLVGDK